MGSPGRKSMMTDARVQVIVDALKGGNTRRAAAAYAGVHLDTFYEWLKKPSFSEIVTNAEAAAEVRAVAIVIQAAQRGDPRAAQWWLERRRRADYGVQVGVEVSGPGGGPIETADVAALSPDEKKRLRQVIDAITEDDKAEVPA
jgi:transposase